MELLNKSRPGKDSYCASFEIPPNLAMDEIFHSAVVITFSLLMNMTRKTMFKALLKKRKIDIKLS